MLNALKYIFTIGNVLGLIFIGIVLWIFKKTQNKHRKTSNDDFLSDSERIIQKKSIKILIIGFTIICITNLINSASLFVIR